MFAMIPPLLLESEMPFAGDREASPARVHDSWGEESAQSLLGTSCICTTPFLAQKHCSAVKAVSPTFGQTVLFFTLQTLKLGSAEMGPFCALNFCIVCPFPSRTPLGFPITESSSESCASRSISVLSTTSWCQNRWWWVQHLPAKPLLAPSCCCTPWLHVGRGAVHGIAASLVKSWVVLNKGAN